MVRPKKTKIKKPNGRPPKANHAPYAKLRMRRESIQAVRHLANILDMDWQDLIDECLQIGAGYVYQRNRLNKAQPIQEIPEIWENLPAVTFKSLKGTEMSPYA